MQDDPMKKETLKDAVHRRVLYHYGQAAMMRPIIQQMQATNQRVSLANLTTCEEHETDEALYRQLDDLLSQTSVEGAAAALPRETLSEESITVVGELLEGMEAPEFIAKVQRLLRAASGLSSWKCNQCGWEASEAWQSDGCGSEPFGSCDGTITVDGANDATTGRLPSHAQERGAS